MFLHACFSIVLLYIHLPEYLLKDICYVPWEVESFVGVNPIFEASKKLTVDMTSSQAAPWLANLDAYILHNSLKKNFKSNKVIVIDLDAQRQVHLVHKHWFSKLNDNVTHMLILIDIISMYSWTNTVQNIIYHFVTNITVKAYHHRVF